MVNRNIIRAEKQPRQPITQGPRAFAETARPEVRIAEDLHARGIVAAREGHHGLALDFIGQAIALNPTSARYRTHLGNVLKDQGRLDEAIACHRMAIGLKLDFAEAHTNLGVALEGQGARDAAISCYRRAIGLNPSLVLAHANLGIALGKQGRLDEAAACYRTAIQLKPDYAPAHANLGNALRDQGLLDAAIACYRQAIGLNPALAVAHANLGTALRRQGQLEEAIACLRHATTLKPDDPAALCDLASALQEQGAPEAACVFYRRAIGLNPALVEAHNNLGVALQEQGALEAAIACFRQAIERKPDYAEAHNNLGVALKQAGALDEAIACFRRGIELRPDHAKTRNNLGNALRDQGALEAAIACYRQAVELQPDYAQAHANLGNALRDQGLMDAAITCYRRAIELKPDFAEAHNNLGVVLQDQGALDAAYEAFDTAVAIAPRRGLFQRMLVSTGRITPASPQFRRLEALAADMTSLSEIDQLEVHFAIGTSYAECGEPEKSIPHLLEGNRLKRNRTRYDEAETLALFDRIRNVFTAGMLEAGQGRGQGRGPASRLPIFVVGMPRSGTTLVEQILASHPRVHGAGELPDLPRLVSLLEAETGAVAFPELAAPGSAEIAPRETLARLGTAYLDGLQARAPSAPHIVDKLPSNFLRIGLIRLALPGARIIHVERDPTDTCLSCFSKLFTGDLAFTYNLGELGRYYRAYRDLMAHWRQALPPGAMLEVRYEDVVSDLEGQARRLFAHCDIPWNDACLAFHQSRRVVRTASNTQVRRPLYASSVGRWHDFSELTRPLLDILE